MGDFGTRKKKNETYMPKGSYVIRGRNGGCQDWRRGQSGVKAKGRRTRKATRHGSGGQG